MALVQVASDDFNRADGLLGANWTTGVDGNDPEIVGNEVVGPGGFIDHEAFYSASAFNNNQYSQAVINAIAGNSYMGVMCRASTTDHVVAQNVDHFLGVGIFWYNGGAFTEIAGDSDGFLVPGDVLRLEAEGTTFRFYVNGVLRLSGTNASAPASGRPGILVSNTGDEIDNWAGGNIVNDNARPSRMMMGMGT